MDNSKSEFAHIFEEKECLIGVKANEEWFWRGLLTHHSDKIRKKYVEMEYFLNEFWLGESGREEKLREYREVKHNCVVNIYLQAVTEVIGEIHITDHRRIQWMNHQQKKRKNNERSGSEGKWTKEEQNNKTMENGTLQKCRRERMNRQRKKNQYNFPLSAAFGGEGRAENHKTGKQKHEWAWTCSNHIWRKEVEIYNVGG